HIGEDRDPVAGIDPLYRVDDVVAALLDIIIGPDGHRLDLTLWSDHMLESRAELNGKLPVCYEDQTDHQKLLAGALAAPRGRATIKTIRCGSTRGPSARWYDCCIAIARHPGGEKPHSAGPVRGSCER